MAWMPPLHLLLAPITADTGATIEQVQLKPLYYAAQKTRWPGPVMTRTTSFSNWRNSPPACRKKSSTNSSARTT